MCEPGPELDVTHLLAEEDVHLSGVLSHSPSSVHLLLSALHPGLHHPLHIPKDHVLMEDTQQGLQTDRQSGRQTGGRQTGKQSVSPV